MNINPQPSGQNPSPEGYAAYNTTQSNQYGNSGFPVSGGSLYDQIKGQMAIAAADDAYRKERMRTIDLPMLEIEKERLAIQARDQAFSAAMAQAGLSGWMPSATGATIKGSTGTKTSTPKKDASGQPLYNTPNGLRTQKQMEDELKAAQWPGGEDPIAAYARTTKGEVTPAMEETTTGGTATPGLYQKTAAWIKDFISKNNRQPTRDEWVSFVSLTGGIDKKAATQIYDQGIEYHNTTGNWAGEDLFNQMAEGATKEPTLQREQMYLNALLATQGPGDWVKRWMLNAGQPEGSVDYSKLFGDRPAFGAITPSSKDTTPAGSSTPTAAAPAAATPATGGTAATAPAAKAAEPVTVPLTGNLFQDTTAWIAAFRAKNGRGPSPDEWITFVAKAGNMTTQQAGSIYDQGIAYNASTKKWADETEFNKHKAIATGTPATGTTGASAYKDYVAWAQALGRTPSEQEWVDFIAPRTGLTSYQAAWVRREGYKYFEANKKWQGEAEFNATVERARRYVPQTSPGGPGIAPAPEPEPLPNQTAPPAVTPAPGPAEPPAEMPEPWWAAVQPNQMPLYRWNKLPPSEQQGYLTGAAKKYYDATDEASKQDIWDQMKRAWPQGGQVNRRVSYQGWQ